MRCAMIFRIWLMGTRSPGMEAAGAPATGDAGRVGFAAGAGLDVVLEADVVVEAAGLASLRSKNAVMSCLVMRPPSPVPATCDRLMLFSRAILRTSGDERAWRSEE